MATVDDLVKMLVNDRAGTHRMTVEEWRAALGGLIDDETCEFKELLRQANDLLTDPKMETSDWNEQLLRWQEHPMQP